MKQMLGHDKIIFNGILRWLLLCFEWNIKTVTQDSSKYILNRQRACSREQSCEYTELVHLKQHALCLLGYIDSKLIFLF